MVLVSPEDHKLNCAIRLRCKTTNNVAKYALPTGLKLAKEIQVRRFFINSDSELNIGQVNGNFTDRDKDMAAYLI